MNFRWPTPIEHFSYAAVILGHNATLRTFLCQRQIVWC